VDGGDMYQTINLENLSKECLIKISCIGTGTPPGTVTKVKIKRRPHGTLPWSTIQEIPINSEVDFTFTLYDNKTKSRRTYDYMAIPVSGETEGIGQTASIKCDFDSIYISDVGEEWICELNPKYDYVKKISASYTKTFNGQRPKKISNGNTNYAIGSVTGLFLPKDSNGGYTNLPEIIEAAQEYKERLLDFLCNGKKKLLRTYDGRMWAVSIDDEPKEVFNGTDGASEIQFQWTEIDSVPTTAPDTEDAVPYQIISAPSLANLDNAVILDANAPS
jgi:hypothetical protein